MNNTIQGVKLCSFNCRSLKSSFADICNLSELYEIVFIQEHWLLPFELGLLNSIHDDFIGIGVSAVDITSDLLKGRPYGGTAILYNKALVSGTNVINCDEPRMCAISIDTNNGPVLICERIHAN